MPSADGVCAASGMLMRRASATCSPIQSSAMRQVAEGVPVSRRWLTRSRAVLPRGAGGVFETAVGAGGWDCG